MQVMIVDDSASDRFLAEEIAEFLGCEVDSIENGSLALDAVSRSPEEYSLILMDLHMPILDGATVARKIKGDQRTKDIPILALTSDIDWLMAEKHTKGGFDGACLKPLDYAQMAQVLQRFT